MTQSEKAGTRKRAFEEQLDGPTRMAIYREFISSGRAPASAALARRLKCSVAQIRGALERLGRSHAIVLEEGTREILRAAPFWASPTAFQVESGQRRWWASCIWDALGIPAMLGEDARILTACGCCSEAMTLSVRGGKLERARGVIHFAVPARRWYEDIVFT